MERAFGYARILSTGAPAPLADVEVFIAGTTTRATIWTDKTASSTKSNPFTADGDGYFFFYGKGRYDIKFAGGGITGSYVWSDVLLMDQLNGFEVPADSREGYQVGQWTFLREAKQETGYASVVPVVPVANPAVTPINAPSAFSASMLSYNARWDDVAGKWKFIGTGRANAVVLAEGSTWILYGYQEPFPAEQGVITLEDQSEVVRESHR